MRRLCLVLLVLAVLFGILPTAIASGTAMNGWVTDMKCGAKAANAGAEACTKKCLAAGEKMAFVTDADHKVLAVENPDALKGHEGHHVAVTGTVNKDAVHVDSVKMLAEGKGGN